MCVKESLFYGLCGRKATVKKMMVVRAQELCERVPIWFLWTKSSVEEECGGESELGSCVKELVPTVSVDAKRH